MHAKLILMRHGRSAWNGKNLFTGWVDIPLDEEGVAESIRAGEKIRHLPIDVIFTSTLVRAQTTLTLAMLNHASGKVPVFLHPGQGKLESWGQIHGEEARRNTIPVYTAWELNERMYGELQGLNKAETAKQFGDAQVKLWRRSFDVPPPEGESLAMTTARTLPYFRSTILPHLAKGQNVFVAAHGNSLRAIVKEIEKLSNEQILEFEIPTGGVLIYRYEHQHGAPSWVKE